MSGNAVFENRSRAKKALALCYAAALVVIAAMLLSPASANAAGLGREKGDSQVTASGTITGCDWKIVDGTHLVISPTPGGSGLLSAVEGGEQGASAAEYPWCSETYASQITRVTVEDGVKTGTNASRLFAGLVSLKSADVSKLNTSNAVDLSEMFHNCYKLASVDVNNFNTTNVVSISQMFCYCYALSSIDMSRWNAQKIASLDETFMACSALTSLRLPASGMPKAKILSGTFEACGQLSQLDLTPLAGAKPTSMQRTFSGNKESILDISMLDTSRVEDMSKLFNGCTVGELRLGQNFNTSQVTDMSYMFNEFSISGNVPVDISGFDTGKVTNMSSMFYKVDMADVRYGTSSVGASLKYFDLSSVENMQSMFEESSIDSVDLSDQNLAKLKTMAIMLRNCVSLQSIDLSGAYAPELRQIISLCHGCTALKSADLSGMDVPKLWQANMVFQGCTSLQDVDLSRTQAPSVTVLNSFLFGAENVRTLSLSGFVVGKVEEAYSVLNGKYVSELDISGFDLRALEGNGYFFGNVFSEATSAKLVLGKNYVSGLKYTAAQGSGKTIDPVPSGNWKRTSTGAVYSASWLSSNYFAGLSGEYVRTDEEASGDTDDALMASAFVAYVNDIPAVVDSEESRATAVEAQDIFDRLLTLEQKVLVSPDALTKLAVLADAVADYDAAVEAEQLANKAAAEAVERLIHALAPYTYEVTEDNYEQVVEAVQAYLALTDAQEKLMNVFYADQIKEYVVALAHYEVQKLAPLVGELPSTIETDADYKQVQAVIEQYDRMTPAQQQLFKDEYYYLWEQLNGMRAKADAYTKKTDTQAEAKKKAEEALRAASIINVATVKAAAIKKASKLGATTITLGPKVKKISAKAFAGTKITTVVIKTTKLKKAKVKNCFKGSKVKTVKVPKSKKKAYKKIFTKKIVGKKVKVKV